MSNYIRIVLLVTLCFSVKTVLAQSKEGEYKTRLSRFPVLNLSHNNYSSASVSVADHDIKYKAEEYKAGFQLAFPLKPKKTYLFNSLSYLNSKYTSEFEQQPEVSHSFHTINYNIGIIKVYPKHWILAVNLIPSLSSDFKEKINSDDFNYNISVMAQKRASENLEYGFGLSYASYVSIVEGGLVVPLISMIYKNNRHITHFLLPSFIHHSYEINSTTNIGFRMAVNGNLNNLMATDNSQNFDLNRISESGVLIGPDFQKKLWGDFHLNINCGMSVGNRIQLQDNGLKTEMEVDVHKRFYFGIGIVLLK